MHTGRVRQHTVGSNAPSYGDCAGPRMVTLKYRRLSSAASAVMPGAAAGTESSAAVVARCVMDAHNTTLASTRVHRKSQAADGRSGPTWVCHKLLRFLRAKHRALVGQCPRSCECDGCSANGWEHGPTNPPTYRLWQPAGHGKPISDSKPQQSRNVCMNALRTMPESTLTSCTLIMRRGRLPSAIAPRICRLTNPLCDAAALPATAEPAGFRSKSSELCVRLSAAAKSLMCKVCGSNTIGKPLQG